MVELVKAELVGDGVQSSHAGQKQQDWRNRRRLGVWDGVISFNSQDRGKGYDVSGKL